MSETSRQAVAPRMLRAALVHVERHVAEPLTVDAISRAVGCSPFWLIRALQQEVGVGVAEYVRRLRLKRASLGLAFRLDRTITEIALQSGYGSPEAFARAFRRVVGQAPSEFRRDPSWDCWQRAFDLPAAAALLGRRFADAGAVGIVARVPTPVAALEHHGPPHVLGETLRRFIAWRKRQRGLSPRASATYNLAYPPEDPQRLRLDVCVATSRRLTSEDAAAGIVPKVIPGGRYARLPVVGTDATLRSAVAFLVHAWLPASGTSARDCPLVLRRHALFPDVAEHEAVTEVLLAIV